MLIALEAFFAGGAILFAASLVNSAFPAWPLTIYSSCGLVTCFLAVGIALRLRHRRNDGDEKHADIPTRRDVL
jgi:hypothetical protein